MKIRKVLYADKGKVLTDGTIYGTTINLAEGRNADDFYEISTEEYSLIMKSINESMKRTVGINEQ